MPRHDRMDYPGNFNKLVEMNEKDVNVSCNYYKTGLF